MPYRSSTFKRSGLTLMELVVVLVILVGLAGIVVPMISNTLSQTRYSTAGANLQEITSVINSYQIKNNGIYPDGWDSLIATNGAISTGLANYLPGYNTLLQTYLQPITLTQANVTTLSNAGIANVYPFYGSMPANPPANPTFYPYGPSETQTGSTAYLPPALALITTSTSLAQLTPQGAQLLNLPNNLTNNLPALTTTTTPVYIVLGLGSRNTMIPRTILDAPVAFADNYNNGPNNQYCRFAVIFQVTDGNNNPLPAAVMVGVIVFSNEQGIATLGNQIENYNKTLIGQ